MGRLGFIVFRALYLAYACVWVAALLFVFVILRTAWYLKAACIAALVLTTPTLDGPWRYRKYVAWWWENIGNPGAVSEGQSKMGAVQEDRTTRR